MSVFGKRVFAVGIAVATLMLMFHSPLAKAQIETDTENLFYADFPAQELDKSKVTIENNLGGDKSEIRTEMQVWERDLGWNATDGSYTGGIFESSLFELDYEPYIQNGSELKTYSLSDFPTDAQWNENSFMNPYYQPSIDGVVIPREAIIGSVDVPVPERRSVLTLASEMVFPNRVIMSGATEFWVKIPIHPICISFELQPTINIFNIGSNTLDETLLTLDDEYRIYYQTSPRSVIYNDDNGFPIGTEVNELGEIVNRAGNGNTLKLQYNSVNPEIFQALDNQLIFDKTAYVHIFATIEPNVNYIFAFSCMLDSKPRIYFNENDICSNGRFSAIMYTDMEFELYNPTNTISHNEWVGEIGDTFIDTVEYAIVNSDSASYIYERETVPIDLGWGVIFKTGRGNHGMFGKKIHFDEMDAITFYKPIERQTNNKYISIMLPFISEKEIDVSITAVLLPLGMETVPSGQIGDVWHSYEILHNRFEDEGVASMHDNFWVNWPSVDASHLASIELSYIKPYWWQSPTSMKYRDYILFSIPQQIDERTFDLHSDDIYVKVMITFEAEADVTFMFSTINPSERMDVVKDVVHTGVDMFSYYSPSAIWEDIDTTENMRVKNTYIYSDVVKRPIISRSHDDRELLQKKPLPTEYYEAYTEFMYVPEQINDNTNMHYELFSSIQITDGLWFELVTSAEGYQYATHFFERRIAIGIVNVWVDTTNNETDREEAWYENEYWDKASQLWSEGDYLGAIGWGIAGAITSLWNGLKSLFGTVIGAFKKGFDALVGLGKFVISIISSFVGWIASIIGDIIDAGEKILDVILYIVAIIVFMYILGKVGKLIYIDRMAKA